MGTTIRDRRLIGALALLMLATAQTQAQYQGYGQTYSPPSGQQLSAQPAAGYVASQAGNRYAPSQPLASGQPVNGQTGYPQYRVASAGPTIGSEPALTNDRYAAPSSGTNQLPAVTPPQGFVTPGMPNYPTLAYRNNLQDAAPAAPATELNAPIPTPPGEAQPPAPIAQPWSAPATASAGAGSSCQGCQTGGACTAASRAGGNCQYGYGANAFNYSTYDCYYGEGGYGKHGHLGGRVMHGTGCNRWFGGAYGLLMERAGGPYVDLAFAASGLAAGDYPASSSAVLTTSDVDLGYQGGIEFRLGRTLGGAYDPCGGASCTPRWGVEGVYWTIFSHDAIAQYVDGATLRTYSMIDPRGLEYDPDGAGPLLYRPVRHYWDYASPVADYTVGATLDDIEVRLARARSQFEAHNVEVNLLQMPMFGGCATGGCATSNCDIAGGSCDTGACATGGLAPRFTCSKFLGFRFMSLEEAFMYGVDFENTTTSATGFINHNVRTENDLYGVQLGCNNIYRIGCKWGIFCNAMFGLYGNDMDVRQYMDVPVGGNVRFIQSTGNFDVSASRSDVSTIGELRVGASYQPKANWRVVAGWRLVGITGVALAIDQIPSAFIDEAQLARVNSSGSMLLHGLQAGVEVGY